MGICIQKEALQLNNHLFEIQCEQIEPQIYQCIEIDSAVYEK